MFEDGESDPSFSTLRMTIRNYNRLPMAVTEPLNRYSGGGRCSGDSIAFIIATCRVDEIFSCCRDAGIDIPSDPTDLAPVTVP